MWAAVLLHWICIGLKVYLKAIYIGMCMSNWCKCHNKHRIQQGLIVTIQKLPAEFWTWNNLLNIFITNFDIKKIIMFPRNKHRKLLSNQSKESSNFYGQKM